MVVAKLSRLGKREILADDFAKIHQWARDNNPKAMQFMLLLYEGHYLLNNPRDLDYWQAMLLGNKREEQELKKGLFTHRIKFNARVGNIPTINKLGMLAEERLMNQRSNKLFLQKALDVCCIYQEAAMRADETAMKRIIHLCKQCQTQIKCGGSRIITKPASLPTYFQTAISHWESELNDVRQVYLRLDTIKFAVQAMRFVKN